MTMDLWEKFVEAAERHFRFLETEFGFTRKSTTQPNVIYESGKIQVQVYYDADGPHELDLGLRRLGDDPRKVPSVGLTAMMLLLDRQAAQQSRAPFPSTEASVENEVQRLAELLRKYGSAFLKADEAAFERVERLRQEREKELGGKNPC